jgi:NAD(P)H-dependent flavin oxidoreductase YrpB (nitropropane dioxygenase family)
VAPTLKTRVTEILGIKYPLVMGTFGYQSTPEFVAAAANAGAFACLSSVMSRTSQSLRERIRKTKSLTDKPFGLNVTLLPMISPLPFEEYIDAALEEGINIFETSGRSPENLVPRIKKGNARLMHKCARLRDARTAERVGADIVEIVGFECGGHPSKENVTSLVLVPQVVDAVKVPVIAGGGIADARGVVAVFALGAEGVLMGTRFLATKECPLPLSLKNKLIEAQSTDTLFVMRTLSDPMRALRNKLTLEVQELEDRSAPPEEIISMLGGQRSLKAMEAGDIENALVPCGQIIGLVHDIPTVKELVEGIMSEVTAVYEQLGKTLGKKR